MATKINDLKSNALFGQTIKPQAVAAPLNGTAIDLVECDGTVTLEVSVGVCTDGNYTVTVEESTASGGTYTAVTLDAVVPTITTTTDDQIYTARFKRSKRFCRAVIAEPTGGTTGVVIAATFIGEKKAIQ